MLFFVTNKGGRNMNKEYKNAKKELDRFQLPTGYSIEDIQVSKVYLETILKLLKLGTKKTNLSSDLYWLLIDTLGKMSNVQGYEIVAYSTIQNNDSETSCVHVSNNKLESVDLVENNIQLTLEDLLEFVHHQDSFLPSNPNEKNAYFHNESVVIGAKKLYKRK